MIKSLFTILAFLGFAIGGDAEEPSAIGGGAEQPYAVSAIGGDGDEQDGSGPVPGAGHFSAADYHQLRHTRSGGTQYR